MGSSASIDRALRDDRIVRMRDAGRSVIAIAADEGITRQAVYQSIRRAARMRAIMQALSDEHGEDRGRDIVTIVPGTSVVQ